MGISDGTQFDTLGPTLTVTTQPAEPASGDAITATAVLTNDCPFPLLNAVLHLINPRATTAAKTIPLGDLRPGAKTTRRWETVRWPFRSRNRSLATCYTWQEATSRSLTDWTSVYSL